MRTPRLLGLLVAALSVATVAEATFLDTIQDKFLGRELARRQDSGAADAASSVINDVTNTDTSSSSAAETSSTSSSEDKDTSTSTTKSSTPSTTTSSTSTTSKSQSADDSSNPGSTPTTDSQPANTGSSTHSDSKTTGSPESSTHSSRKTTFTSTYTTVYTTTNANGQVQTTTDLATTTGTATLAAATDSNNGGSGLTTGQRNTVIGVVVGVGGAALIAGLAFVWWRLRNKNRSHDEAEDLIAENPSDPLASSEMRPAGSPNGPTPFQRNLETYHQPATNASSNF